MKVSKIYPYGIIAIHGGAIEKGTSEIARALAGSDFPLFLNEKGPHIPSTEFCHPDLERLSIQCEKFISIHGEKTKDESFVIVGGLDADLAKKIEQSFLLAGFVQKHYPDRLRGIQKENVCNRARLKKGVQLEISYKLRMDLLEDKNKLSRFVESIKKVL